jgi:hypothetical protein
LPDWMAHPNEGMHVSFAPTADPSETLYGLEKQGCDGTTMHSCMWSVAPWAPDAMLKSLTSSTVDSWIVPAGAPPIPWCSVGAVPKR